MKPRVRNLLRHKGADIVTIHPDATVYTCIARMVDANVGSIVVVDATRVVGIFTERDYLRRIALEGRTSRTTLVSDVMTTEVLTVTPDHTVDQCMTLMTQARCRHLPVVDDDRLVGIVSIGDCVREVSEDAKSQVATLERFISGEYPG